MKTKFAKSKIEITNAIIFMNYFDGNNIPIDIFPLKQSKSGVYCLRNKLNGRLYIGMARNLFIRRDRHLNDLMHGKHHSKFLQKDFDDINKNPEGSFDWGIAFDERFEFEIIIYCYPSQLTFWENILIKQLQPYYNVASKEKEISYEID